MYDMHDQTIFVKDLALHSRFSQFITSRCLSLNNYLHL